MACCPYAAESLSLELTSQFAATWTSVSPAALRHVTVKAVKWRARLLQEGLHSQHSCSSMLDSKAGPSTFCLHLCLFLKMLSFTLTATASFYYLLDSSRIASAKFARKKSHTPLEYQEF